MYYNTYSKQCTFSQEDTPEVRPSNALIELKRWCGICQGSQYEELMTNRPGRKSHRTNKLRDELISG